MDGFIIAVDPDRPNFPLRPIWGYRGHAVRFSVSGLPKDVYSVAIIVQAFGVDRPYRILFYPERQPQWIPAHMMPLAGQGRYEIQANIDGRSMSLGQGNLTVRETLLSPDGSPAPEGALPAAQGMPIPLTRRDGQGRQLYKMFTVVTLPETGEDTPSLSDSIYIFKDGRYQEVWE